MYDFEKATIKDKNGITRPLILSQHDVVKCQTSINNEKGFPLRPSTCAWIFLGCIIITTIIEICFKKNFWFFDALLNFIWLYRFDTINDVFLKASYNKYKSANIFI